MFNVYATQAMNGEGFTMREPTPIFLETVVSANEATLDEFRALGYTGVFAVPMEKPDLSEKEIEGWKPPQPAPAIEWPSGFENPEEWEKTVAEQSQREAEEKKREEETDEEREAREALAAMEIAESVEESKDEETEEGKETEPE